MNYTDLELKKLEKDGLCKTDVGDGAYVVHQMSAGSISAHIVTGDDDIILVCNNVGIRAMMVRHNPMIEMQEIPVLISPTAFIPFLKDMLRIFHTGSVICKTLEEVRDFVSRLDNLVRIFILNKPIRITFYDENRDRFVGVEVYAMSDINCSYTVFQDPDEIRFSADVNSIADLIIHFLFPEEEISDDVQEYIQSNMEYLEKIQRINKSYLKAIGVDPACIMINDEIVDDTTAKELQEDTRSRLADDTKEKPEKRKGKKKGKKGEK